MADAVELRRRPHMAGRRLQLLLCAIVIELGLRSAWPAWAEPLASPPALAQPRNLGAIGQSNAPSTPSLPAVTSDRNAAYFNRPGAIPLKSFQPINNAAPIVQQAAPGALDPGPPPVQPAARPTLTPSQTVATPPRGPQPLIRPAPVAGRVLKERTRVVPGIIIRPKPAQLKPFQPQPARVYPAFGQPPRQAGGAIQRIQTPAQPSAAGTLQLQAAQIPQSATQQGPGQPSANQPSPLRPGTIIAPPPIARPGFIPRQATAPKPYSQTTGSLPTVAPRPHSLFDPPKPKPPIDPTATKQGAPCAGGLATC